jgi:hypothetical protein
LINSFDYVLPERLHPNGTLVKYPSALCPLSRQIQAKKVFLYRTLGEHILWMSMRKHYQISIYFNYMDGVRHPLLYDKLFETKIEKEVFLWLNRVLWMQEDDDVMWVSSSDFFSKKEETTEKICKFFSINPVTDFSIAKLNVKEGGLNHLNEPLDTKKIRSIDPVPPSYGLLENFVLENSSNVEQARERALSLVPQLRCDLI